MNINLNQDGAQRLKSLGVALGLSVVLFFYGYFLSTAGHDHAEHQGNGHQHDV